MTPRWRKEAIQGSPRDAAQEVEADSTYIQSKLSRNKTLPEAERAFQVVLKEMREQKVQAKVDGMQEERLRELTTIAQQHAARSPNTKRPYTTEPGGGADAKRCHN